MCNCKCRSLSQNSCFNLLNHNALYEHTVAVFAECTCEMKLEATTGVNAFGMLS